MEKDFLRKIYRQKRLNLTDNQIKEKSQSIALLVKKLPCIEKAQYCHIFLPIAKFNEVQTLPIIEYLIHINKKIVLSKTSFKDGSMTHYLYNHQTKIIVNSYGIPEPTSGIEISPQNIDIVFVPLLVFDLFGNRIGYGKGFYDRFLAQTRPDTLKVGLSLLPAFAKKINIAPNDIPLDFCITPKNIHTFAKN